MDLHKIIADSMKAKRSEDLSSSPQLLLGKFILKLEAVSNKNLPVVFDDGVYHPMGLDSWRGSYCELSLEYSDMADDIMSFKDVLKDAKDMVGKTLTGYKGGDFYMGKNTPIWVANYGMSSGFKESDDIYTQAVVDVVETPEVVSIVTKLIDY